MRSRRGFPRLPSSALSVWSPETWAGGGRWLPPEQPVRKGETELKVTWWSRADATPAQGNAGPAQRELPGICSPCPWPLARPAQNGEASWCPRQQGGAEPHQFPPRVAHRTSDENSEIHRLLSPCREGRPISLNPQQCCERSPPIFQMRKTEARSWVACTSTRLFRTLTPRPSHHLCCLPAPPFPSVDWGGEAVLSTLLICMSSWRVTAGVAPRSPQLRGLVQGHREKAKILETRSPERNLEFCHSGSSAAGELGGVRPHSLLRHMPP